MTFIFLHGVYEDTSLFEPLSEDVKKMGYDFFNLNLPGHGDDWQNSYHLNFTQWLQDVQNQVQAVTKLNKKIIFVTHSLGSLIAINSALDSPHDIAGIVAIEPALSPRPIIKNSVCIAKNLLKDARMFLPLARTFLRIPAKDRPIAVNMACETVKTIPYLLEKTESSELSDLAIKIKTPVLMINNLRDNAVDPNENKNFFDCLANQHQSLYHDFDRKGFPHGSIIPKDKELILDLLKVFLSSSLHATLPKNSQKQTVIERNMVN